MQTSLPRKSEHGQLNEKDNTILCQAYQRKQCTDNPCPRGAHACAVVLRASGFTCGLKHPACLHNKDARRASRQAKRAKKVEQASVAATHSGNQPASEQEQQTPGKCTQQQPGSSSLHIGVSKRASAKPVPPLGAPPRATAYGSESETTQRTEGQEHQCSIETHGDTDTSDEYAPPHFVDTLLAGTDP